MADGLNKVECHPDKRAVCRQTCFQGYLDNISTPFTPTPSPCYWSGKKIESNCDAMQFNSLAIPYCTAVCQDEYIWSIIQQQLCVFIGTGTGLPWQGSGTCFHKPQRSWAHQWPFRIPGRWRLWVSPRCRWSGLLPASSAGWTSEESACSGCSAPFWKAPVGKQSMQW